MFKSQEQVAIFVDMTEKFIKSVIINHNSPHVEDAVSLNKMRAVYETFLETISGITTASDTTDTLACPDCGHDMALRTNKTNGNKFWGCKKFPTCRGTRDEDGLSKSERDEKKLKTHEANYSHEGGFSFNKPKRDVVNEVAPPPAQTGWINPFAK